MNSLEAFAGRAASGLIFIALPLGVLVYLVRGWIRQPARTGVRGWLGHMGRAAGTASSGLGLFLVLAPMVGGSSADAFMAGGTMTLAVIRAGTSFAIGGLLLSAGIKGPERWKLAAVCTVLAIYWVLVDMFQ